MEKGSKPSNIKTLAQAKMPDRVLSLCEGLFKIGTDFLERRLELMLNEFHETLSKNAERSRGSSTQFDHFSGLRNLSRTQHDFIPRYLGALEQRLASIRQQHTPVPRGTAPDAPVSGDFRELSLLEHYDSEHEQVRFEMTSRCESQNSFDIFLLGQRFGILAGTSAFDNEKIPLGPRALAACLAETMPCLDLDTIDQTQLTFIFDRNVFGNYPALLNACNHYLIDNGVLPNLSYVPFRNPELRHKKSPMAQHLASGGTAPVRENNVVSLFPDVDIAAGLSTETIPAEVEENFNMLRQLLSHRKQLLGKLNKFTSQYLGERSSDADSNLPAMPASTDQIAAILNDFQLGVTARGGAGAGSIQHLKNNLLAQLRNQSTEERELVLGPEDNDAIDLVGLLMDEAMQGVNPQSSISQLIGLMQTPIVQVVLQDKTFFSNRVHPARQMLTTLADAGFNWLNDNEPDEALHNRISDIVTNAVNSFDGNINRLNDAYHETDRLLQSLIRKAEAAERRQIEAAKGKERLNLARTRAEATINELMAARELPVHTKAMLNRAWADVLALTELREGADSSSWKVQKAVAERLVAANSPTATAMDADSANSLKTAVQQSLSLVGYHEQEAKSIADALVAPESNAPVAAAMAVPEKTRLGGDTRIESRAEIQLDDNQMRIADQIKELPIGSWFEFNIDGSSTPARRKLAWLSKVNHTVLFVNQRGQKTAELLIEDLAIEVSEGRARIEPLNRRNIFERAFESVIKSLRGIMSTSGEKSDD